MNSEVVSPLICQYLSEASRRLQAERKTALSKLSVRKTEWEYAGRLWSWPGGEELKYFFDLAPGEANVINDLISQKGFDLIGVGTGRVAVSLPDSVGNVSTVAKLARYGISSEMGDGRQQNRYETKIFNQIDDHPFLPILDACQNYHWVVMPEASILSEKHPEADTALKTVRDKLIPHQSIFHFDELKIENIGAYDSDYWILDYGRPSGEPLFEAHRE